MRVLVCDDHFLLASALAERLRARGHEVRVETTPEDAVAAAAADQPDVCLMEIRFAGRPLAGLRAMPDLRARAPHTSVLLLSANADAPSARAAVAAGAQAVIGKDVSLAALERAVEQFSRRSPVLPDEQLGVSGRTLLTDRERTVIDLVAAGRSTARIARDLAISPATVRGHVEAVLRKLDVHSRLEAAALVGRPLRQENAS